MTTRKRILVVDDEENLRDVTKLILEFSGYDVVCVGTGHEAFKIVKDGLLRIDAIITDESMPIMRGSKLVKTIRKFNSSIPMIVTSGNIGNKLRTCLANYSVTFLEKPYSREDLVDAINKMFP